MYFILLRLLMYISINMAKDIVNNMQMINTALSFWYKGGETMRVKVRSV